MPPILPPHFPGQGPSSTTQSRRNGLDLVCMSYVPDEWKFSNEGLAYLWRLRQPRLVKNARDLVDYVIQQCQSGSKPEDRKVASLLIIGHGLPGHMAIGEDAVEQNSVQRDSPVRKQLERLTEWFAQEALVIMGHCYAGTNFFLLSELSKMWGTRADRSKTGVRVQGAFWQQKGRGQGWFGGYVIIQDGKVICCQPWPTTDFDVAWATRQLERDGNRKRPGPRKRPDSTGPAGRNNCPTRQSGGT